MSQTRNRAEAGLGAAGVAATLGRSHIERGYNNFRGARFDRRIQALENTFGLDERGRPVADPRARNLPGAGATRGQKQVAYAARRRKFGAIHDLRHQKKASKIRLKGRAGVVWTGMGVSTPLLWHGLRSEVNKRELRRRDVDAAFAGTLGGAGLYQGGSYALKPVDRAMERRIARDDELRMLARRYSNAKLPRGIKAGDPRWLEYFRNYPLDLPGGRMKRVLAHTHGGRKGAAATALAALFGGAGLAHASRQVRVGKSDQLYIREKRTSIPRSAMAATGLGMMAWGGPRLRLLGPALRHGVRAAHRLRSPDSADALIRAQELAGALENGTRVPEHALRRIRALDSAIEAVPRSIRPEVATVAGALLLGQARPIRRDRYVPAGVRQGGW